ncbi:STAS domain-containing protein [Noviherbaspirillum aridicola]|uniref:Polyvinyl alcohol dehydrogenase n=1 Tax=Noviherbaspirillum aridicola TaxID=2849687 RepID=A0ABQ4PZZ1_9BURK|nr:STAS domain-containing protein [Noviherbaspirillum aridicola]GIZ50461.1 polyvinyl alcohol dehydrogenase [Noviherbaspirillum aridicola]
MTLPLQIAGIFEKFQPVILEEWLQDLKARMVRVDADQESQLRQQCAQFLRVLQQGAASGQLNDIEAREWDEARAFLSELSHQRARQGSTPSETAVFVFSIKQPLFARLRTEFADQPEQLAGATWSISTLLDALGLFTVEVYQKSRDQIIVRQQQELLELSTPVVKLWQNVLALPLIGTLDSNRTQVVMESLLQRIIETSAAIAIIDITGVPTVDTLVAQHLLKTVAAARLMGADCIISGIRPQIAQTIVHLGVNLEDVITKATLADAFLVALQRTGSTITTQQREHA